MDEFKEKVKEIGPEFRAVGGAFKEAFTKSVPHIKQAGRSAGEAFGELGEAAKPHIAKAGEVISDATEKVFNVFRDKPDAADTEYTSAYGAKAEDCQYDPDGPERL